MAQLPPGRYGDQVAVDSVDVQSLPLGRRVEMRRIPRPMES